MYIAAIFNLSDNRDALAETLAGVLNTSLYEARSRLRADVRGPLVVALNKEHGPVEDIVKKLQTEGVEAFLLDRDRVESWTAQPVIKKFRFDEAEFVVYPVEGGSLAINYNDIDLILRGTCIAVRRETETVKERKFSLSRTLITSGMVTSKKRVVTRHITAEDREGFFSLYLVNGPTIVFFEKTLIYDSLGPELRPSRAENFTCLINKLRRRQPDAVFDDRLLRRAEQAAILGPLLSPEENLEVALSLLSKTLRRKA